MTDGNYYKHDNRYVIFYEKKSRLLRNDVPYFNQCGVDGLIIKKRPGTMTIIKDQQATQLAQLATDVFAALLARSQPHRAHLADDESALVQQTCLQK